ncbi:MAG: cobalamin-dependent protein [Spirochaetia bacterium]|nr:cobalamin-dependent protein [Spirochaetia bacterium]
MIREKHYSTYLQALLSGDQKRCTEIVSQLLDEKVDIKMLYNQLFQRSLYETGELWEMNKISVATEHLATSITESLLTLVYPIIFSKPHNERTAIVSCVANEFHQIGGKIVADFLELNGWHAHFLGANTPVKDLVEFIDKKEPDLVALSLSLYFNLPKLHKTIEVIRAHNQKLPILVGGQAFRWGGQELQYGYEGVRLLTSLDELESVMKTY